VFREAVAIKTEVKAVVGNDRDGRFSQRGVLLEFSVCNSVSI